MTARLGVRARLRHRLLAGHRHLAGGPDLPVLHDHRPEDLARRSGRTGRLRLPRGRRERPAHGAADRRVRDQGRAARRTRRRVRGPARPRPLPARAEVGRRPDRRLRETRGGRPRAAPGVGRVAARVGLVVAAVFVLGAGIVVAGTPARGTVAADTSELLAACPTRSIRRPSRRSPSTSRPGTARPPAPIAQGILVTLAENLELENQALLRRDPTLLTAVDHGDRLTEMQARLKEAETTGRTVVVALPVRFGPRRRHRAVRRADGSAASASSRAAQSPRRPTTRAVRWSTGRRRRSRGRSRSGGRPATAGSTSATCPLEGGG